jgi:hypothetical protein
MVIMHDEIESSTEEMAVAYNKVLSSIRTDGDPT